VDYKLNKKRLITGKDFGRRDSRTSKLLKVRNEVIREKLGVPQFWKDCKTACCNGMGT
jgi:hypothetical protein